MSDFHTEIETAIDLNNALSACGCCALPLCLQPLLECQSQPLRLCYFRGEDEKFPDDEAPGLASDSDSQSESCPTYWSRYRYGSSGSFSNSSIGELGAVFRVSETSWTLLKTEDLPNIWAAGNRSCERVTTCQINGNYSLTENFIQYVENDFSNSGFESFRGPYPSKTITGVLSDYAGQQDPTLDSSDIDRLLSDSGANLDPSDLILPPCSPIWRYETTWYDAIIGSESDNDGHLIGSIERSKQVTYVKSGFSEAVDGDESDGITYVREYSRRITCESARAAQDDLGSSGWPSADSDSTSRTQDEIDEDNLGVCEANYICSPCGLPPSGRRLRYRWKIPPCHGGSYYRIDWDEVFFPQSYLDWLAYSQRMTSDNLDSNGNILEFYPNENPPPELPRISPKSWTWNGAALGECPSRDDMSESFSEDEFLEFFDREYNRRLNDISRRSPWSATVYAPEAGIVEIRNVRVSCFRSPFGEKPQPIGGFYDDFDLDDLDQDGRIDADERYLDTPESSSI